MVAIMIYKLFIPFDNGFVMALQTKSAEFCLDKYRRLQEQGHDKIKIEFINFKLAISNKRS